MRSQGSTGTFYKKFRKSDSLVQKENNKSYMHNYETLVILLTTY